MGKLTAVSLFSGGGGMDVGFSAAGFDIVAQVEIDKYCKQVLRQLSGRWWPNAKHFEDVREFDRRSIRGHVDVIFGGFPCQPFSAAGKMLGADDPRNMWPATVRIISEFRPRYVLLENVPRLASANTKENGDISPAYLGLVAKNLADIGYDGRWTIISADDVGLPHKRKRLWIVAHPSRNGQLASEAESHTLPYKKRGMAASERQGDELHEAVSVSSDVADSNSQRRKVGSNCLAERHIQEKSIGDVAKTQSKRHKRKHGVAPRCLRTGKLGHANSKRGKGHRGKGKQISKTRLGSRQPSGAGARVQSRHNTLCTNEPRLGRNANGVPSWLDSPRIPAGQGNFQYPFEPPRLLEASAPHDSDRIKLVGNSVVPQIPYAIATEIYEQLTRLDSQ